MFIAGVHTIGVGHLVEELTGVRPSPNVASRVFDKLENEFAAWKMRKLARHYVYCFANGTYFSVIYDHEGCNMQILAVIAIRPDRQRETPRIVDSVPTNV